MAVAVVALRVLRRGDLGSEADKATYATLNRASQAAPALREGLTEVSTFAMQLLGEEATSGQFFKSS